MPARQRIRDTTRTSLVIAGALTALAAAVAIGRLVDLPLTPLLPAGIAAGIIVASTRATQRLIGRRRAKRRTANTPRRREDYTAYKLRDAIDSIPDGFAVYDADDRLLACNASYRRIYPWVADVLVPGVHFETVVRACIDRGVYATMDGHDPDLLVRRLSHHRAGRREHLQCLTDGRWIHVRESRTADGATVGIWKDVTHTRDRDTELRRQARVFRQLAEAVLIIDFGERVMEANPAAELLLGRDRGGLVGQPLTALLAEVGEATLVREVRPELRRDGRWSGELMMRHADGDRRHLEAEIAPFTDDTGALVAYVLIGHDVTERRLAEARLDHLANHDALTQLPNRRLFRDRLEQALELAHWRGQKLALVVFDLDNFNLINEGLGQEMGDQVLQEVTRRLTQLLRQGDSLARVGGDKFALIQTEVADAEQAALRTRHALDLLEAPVRLGEHELRVSASAGIAVWPEHGNDGDELTQSAEVSLSRAKAEGRNHYHFYVEGMTEQTRLRCALEHDIGRAMKQGEFLLHYQPQWDLVSGRLIGCEALLRWQHPELGLLLPDQFIAIAEESGDIVPLGEWGLGEVCRQMAEWRAAGVAPNRVAVNLSPVQFHSAELVESVARALRAAGLPAACLELEITESVAMRDPDRAVDTLSRLNELGVQSVIDDFGTGYSSLSYLKRFPVHSLKIDQSFVAGLSEDDSDGAIVSAVIDLGHSLNLSVMAEGIETQAQAEFLHRNHCDFGQGHSFARAMPAAACAEFMASRQ